MVEKCRQVVGVRCQGSCSSEGEVSCRVERERKKKWGSMDLYAFFRRCDEHIG